jgi:hypothetical protein
VLPKSIGLRNSRFLKWKPEKTSEILLFWNNLKAVVFVLILFLNFNLYSQTTKTVGTTGDYTSLKLAFDAINNGSLTGVITLQIISSVTSNVSAVLNASGSGSANYSSVTIFPTGSGYSLSGSLNGALFSLNGADNVTFDGRVNGTGSTKDLIISNINPNSSASTIQFLNSAENNTVKYCTIKGGSINSTGGVIFFSTSISGNGNDGNLIDNCNITNSVATRLINAVFSQGSSGFDNSNNTISNNYFYDFLRTSAASTGIFISSFSTDWTISGNSFYETTTFIPSAGVEYDIIRIDNASGNNFVVSGNFIGGQAASCGGSSWTKTNAINNPFCGIYLNVGTITPGSIQNNTIRNFTWRNSTFSDWTGIKVVAGSVNIGTATGNTIGSGSGTGSILVASGGTGANFYGIQITGAGVVDCRNNIIGSITCSNVAASASNIYGILKAAVAGTTTIKDNVIGSTVTSTSINSSSASSANNQIVTGISNSGTGDVTISGNTVANLNNATTNTTGSVNGLYCDGSTGTNAVKENFILNLTASGGATTANIYGIKVSKGSTTYSNNIISIGGNTLSIIYGIYETGIATNNNNLYFNTVYLSGSPTTGSLNSYALYSAASTNIRDFRNNILNNSRSNSGATGKHYGAYFNYGVSTSLTLDFNNYYATGSGGVAGYYNGADMSLPIVTGLDLSSISITPAFALAGGTAAANYKPSATKLIGTTIAGITTDYAGISRASTPTIGAYEGSLLLNVDVYQLGVLQSTNLHLKDAFDKINNGTHTGVLELRITANSIETSPAVLNASGSGGANYTSVTIFPTVSGLTISGNFTTPMIDFNGADNVTIDGRVNASGSEKDLILANNNTGSSSSVIRFINSAENNTVKYCTIKGSETGTADGIIFFSTASSGNGNDGNTIDNNNITGNSAGRPVNAVYSSGSSGFENSGNILTSNNIYDFINQGIASNGIFISSYSTAWTVSGNNFYETTSFIPASSVEYDALRIDNISGINFTVTGNYIGGNASLCGGSAWTKTSAFNNIFKAIYLNVGTGTASSVQNNTIQNFSWSNSGAASWSGIEVNAGAVNIGTVTGNTIGDGTGNITISGGASGTNVYGISITSNGNIILGSNTIKYLINSTANTNCNVVGILFSGGTGTNAVKQNFIHNLSASAASIYGIQITAGAATYSNNIISLGGNNTNIIYGIYENGLSGNDNNLYFNTVYIGGTPVSGNLNSYGLYSNASSNTRNFRDNIFENARSNSGATGKHYSAWFNYGVNSSLTLDYNDYFAPGTNGVLGYYNGSDVSSLPLISTFDSHSVAVNPVFLNAGGSSAADYVPSSGTLAGILIAAVPADFISTLRTGIPTMGAFEMSLRWNGSLSSTWTTSNNWTPAAVPSAISNVFIPNSLTTPNDPDLPAVAELQTITIESGGILNSVASAQLTINGAAGAWNNEGGTFNPNTSTVIFTNTASTVSGTNDFNNVTISTGKSLLMASGSIMRIGGVIANNGTWDAIAGGSTTVVFNGADQSVVNPNGTSPGYYNLVLTGSGTKTLNSVKVSGILTMDGTAIVSGSPTYGVSATLKYNSTSAHSAGPEWITPFSSTGGILLTNTGVVTLSGSRIVNASAPFTIGSSSVFVIDAGSNLTVNSTLTNSGGSDGLKIKSSALGDGQFIYNGLVIGTVELYLSGGLVNPGVGKFHYFVPPVSSVNIGSSVASVQTALGITPGNFTGNLSNYSEVTAAGNKDAGWHFFDGYNSTTPFSTLSPAQGYDIYLKNNDVITFQGQLNSSDHSFGPLSYTNLGWNLVGNPFPCNYDLNGIAELSGTGDGVDNSIYFNHNGRYLVYNLITGGETGYTNIIPPMQGFFVKVTESGKSISLPASSKTSGTSSARSKGAFASKSVYLKKIKMAINSGTTTDETIVCLLDKSTAKFDGDFDAYKFIGNGAGAPYIYTQLNSVKYAINCVPESQEGPVIIPMTVILKEKGTYKIDIKEFENLDNMKVVLKHGPIRTDLSSGSSYSFVSEPGTYNDFQLIIGKTQKVVDNIPGETGSVWYSNNMLYISSSGIGGAEPALSIYNSQGNCVFNKKVTMSPDELLQVPLNLKTGVYIVRLYQNSMNKTAKISVF